ncbi:MAG: serine/threonine protein kinase [Verrucomicrobia bacterium]|nr:MAG: serine/threonine protein kinase [Verrucomicrobiota bacterium]
MNRREFLALVALTPALTGASCRQLSTAPGRGISRLNRFFFVSQGKTAIMNTDGAGLRYLDFRMPNQVTWQPGPFLPDGRRVVFLSMEARRDGPGRPFDEYYTQTPTHLWLYDLDRESLTEIAMKERLAVFYTPALLVTDQRILVQVMRNKIGQIFSMNLDGSDAREFTRAGEGLPYGLSLSPDKRRVAFHLATGQGYQIWTSDTDGANRVRVAAHPDHLYFGTSWSPDGQWILYQDCHFKTDPGHDWSDLCIGRPDGSEHRVLTDGRMQWFGAAYGPRHNPASGSNMPSWTRNGCILFSRKIPGSKVPWEFQPNRPDTDHFNRDFKPDLARGGAEICRLDLRDNLVTRLTHSEPSVWDFRPSESPDGRQIIFCRAQTGGVAGIWVMAADGRGQHLLTRGLDDKGADHPRWLPTTGDE